MKLKIHAASLVLRVLTVAIITALTSCKNPEDTRKVIAIGEKGLDILVAKKVLKPEDADIARQTGQLLITPAATPAPSGK